MVTALPPRVTLAVAGGLGMVWLAALSIFMSPIWARPAVARRVQQAAVARVRKNIGESLFLGARCGARWFCGWPVVLKWTSVMMLNRGGVGCQQAAIDARLEERARSSAG